MPYLENNSLSFRTITNLPDKFKDLAIPSALNCPESKSINRKGYSKCLRTSRFRCLISKEKIGNYLIIILFPIVKT